MRELSVTSNPSRIDLSLIKAYRAAEYWLFEPLVGEYLLCHVGVPSDSLARMLKHDGLEGAAYITAYNPAPFRPCTEEFNKRQNWRLLEAVNGLGGTVSSAYSSEHDDITKYHESGWLVLGLGRDVVADLARAFQQDAILWFDVTGTAELVLLV